MTNLHTLLSTGTHSTVDFKNASDGQKYELEVKGDWFDRSAEITYGGRPVANISRSFFNVREVFGDKQTVRLSCFPFPLDLVEACIWWVNGANGVASLVLRNSRAWRGSEPDRSYLCLPR